jgi:hypothetical protein
LRKSKYEHSMISHSFKLKSQRHNIAIGQL